TRSARLSCSTAAARAGPRAEAPVLDARDLETAPPLDFLAAAPSAVVVMATPSGPQRRDTTGPVPTGGQLRPSHTEQVGGPYSRGRFPGRCCVIPTVESAPGRGCRHHPFR